MVQKAKMCHATARDTEPFNLSGRLGIDSVTAKGNLIEAVL